MSRPSVSIESTCAVLSCTSEEFWTLYEDDYTLTETLVNHVLLNVIHPNKPFLRAANNEYHLDDLLSAMLVHAPHPGGQRYVAVAILIAHGKGVEDLIKLGDAWVEHLLFPILSASQIDETFESSSGATPVEDMTLQNDLKERVALRENHRCAVTGIFDRFHKDRLIEEKRYEEIPVGVAMRAMTVAHIIPISFNGLSNMDHLRLKGRETRTWDFLQSWTHISPELLGPLIKSPENAIYMTCDDSCGFAAFDFYFDKNAFPNIPNKYQIVITNPATTLLSDGKSTTDAEFLTQSGVAPPSSELLNIHAAFAKVVQFSGALQYFLSFEWGVEKSVAQVLPMDVETETNFARLLSCKLSILSH